MAANASATAVRPGRSTAPGEPSSSARTAATTEPSSEGLGRASTTFRLRRVRLVVRKAALAPIPFALIVALGLRANRAATAAGVSGTSMLKCHRVARIYWGWVYLGRQAATRTPSISGRQDFNLTCETAFSVPQRLPRPLASSGWSFAGIHAPPTDVCTAAEHDYQRNKYRRIGVPRGFGLAL